MKIAETCLNKVNRPYGKNATDLILLRMKNLAVALYARATMRKSTSAKSVAIGIQRMNCMTVGAKNACVNLSPMTHSLSIARQTRTGIILTHLLCVICCIATKSRNIHLMNSTS